MKIRSHLFLLAFGTIVPLLVVSIVAVMLLVQHERRKFESEAIGRARAAMSAVDAELRGSIATLQALAASKNLETGNIRGFREEARRVLASQQPGWRNIGLATVTRVQLIDAVRPYGKPAPFGAGDKSFDAAIKTRLPTIGDVTAGPAVSEPSVRIRVPVMLDGEVRYVLSAPIDPASFDDLLSAQHLPDGWAIGLVDREKRFIARLPAVPVGTAVSNEFRTAIEHAPTGWYWSHTPEAGATYTPYDSSPLSGWVLGIAIPESVVDAGVWRTTWIAAAGLLVALGAALALALLIARRIAAPIVALADAAQGIATHIDAALPGAGRIEEIARLHNSFREASRVVRDRQTLLENEQTTLREQAELLDLAHDAIMVCTAAGEITFWSNGAEETYGWRKSEAIGKSVRELLRTEFPRPMAEVDAEFDRLGRWEGTLRHSRKDGDRIVVASRWALRRGQAGETDLVLEINRDITRQTAAEESIVRLNHELIEANKRKDEFLAVLAHELRNPLAPIANSVTMLKSTDLPERERSRASAVIERQVGQMSRLLDDLLDVSRITHGKLELRRQRVALAQVVEAAVEISRPQIESGGHELIVALGPQPLYLDADPLRVAQIIANLLTNAVRYSNDGTRIWLNADERGNEISVSVRDEGIGISAGMLPWVFDLFAQANSTPDPAHGGMGIGLSLVRALAELHGGTAQARSEGLGKGSEFIVRLPAASAPEAGQAVNVPRGGVPRDIPISSFLVADDLPDSADSLAILLRHLGHEVHTAYDGEQAFAAAAKFKPRVALLDIGMPKLNGYDLARRIREQPWGKDMLLVAVSGWGQQEDRRLSHEAGFTHHLVKPLDFGELAAIMKSVFPAP